MAKVVETLIEFSAGTANEPDRFEVRLWMNGPTHDYTRIREYMSKGISGMIDGQHICPSTENVAEAVSNSAMVSEHLNAVQVKDVRTHVSTLVYPEWP